MRIIGDFTVAVFRRLSTRLWFACLTTLTFSTVAWASWISPVLDPTMNAELYSAMVAFIVALTALVNSWSKRRSAVRANASNPVLENDLKIMRRDVDIIKDDIREHEVREEKELAELKRNMDNVSRRVEDSNAEMRQQVFWLMQSFSDVKDNQHEVLNLMRNQIKSETEKKAETAEKSEVVRLLEVLVTAVGKPEEIAPKTEEAS